MNIFEKRKLRYSGFRVCLDECLELHGAAWSCLELPGAAMTRRARNASNSRQLKTPAQIYKILDLIIPFAVKTYCS